MLIMSYPGEQNFYDNGGCQRMPVHIFYHSLCRVKNNKRLHIKHTRSRHDVKKKQPNLIHFYANSTWSLTSTF